MGEENRPSVSFVNACNNLQLNGAIVLLSRRHAHYDVLTFCEHQDGVWEG